MEPDEAATFLEFHDSSNGFESFQQRSLGGGITQFFQSHALRLHALRDRQVFQFVVVAGGPVAFALLLVDALAARTDTPRRTVAATVMHAVSAADAAILLGRLWASSSISHGKTLSTGRIERQPE
jgi:hypothetical protein